MVRWLGWLAEARGDVGLRFPLGSRPPLAVGERWRALASSGERCAVRPPGSGMRVKFETRWAVRADGTLVGMAGRGPRRRGAPLPTGLTPTARRWRARRALASSGERCAVRPPGSGMTVKFETRWAVRADGALVGMAGRGPRRRGAPLPTGLTPTARRWRVGCELWRAVCRQASGERDDGQIRNPLGGSCGWYVGWDCWPRPEATWDSASHWAHAHRSPLASGLASSGERCAVRPPGSGMRVKFETRWAVRADGALVGMAGRGPRRRWGSASHWAHAHRSPLASVGERLASSGERCAVRPPGSGMRVKFETRWAVRADGTLVGMAGRGPRRRGTPLPTGLTPTARRRRAFSSSGELSRARWLAPGSASPDTTRPPARTPTGQ